MKKIEIICPSCETHYVIVTKESEKVNHCPFCGTPYSDEELNDDVENTEDDQT